MPNAIPEEFKKAVQEFGDPITSIECHQNKMFGCLNVLVVNNGKTEWFIAKEVMRSIGYKTDRIGIVLSRTVRPSEIRKITSTYNCTLKLPYKITSRGLYLISELGINDLVLNSNVHSAIEYKLWVSEIVKQIHHTGEYRCEISEANKQLEKLFGNCDIPHFDISPYQQGAYIDVVSFDQYGEQEIDNNYKLRIINLAYFLVFHQTYSNLDPQSIYTGDIRTFEIAHKFGGPKLVNIISANIQFILNLLSCNGSLLDLENWIYGFYPINYTPKYNIFNGSEIQKMQENNVNNAKQIKEI